MTRLLLAVLVTACFAQTADEWHNVMSQTDRALFASGYVLGFQNALAFRGMITERSRVKLYACLANTEVPAAEFQAMIDKLDPNPNVAAGMVKILSQICPFEPELKKADPNRSKLPGKTQ